MASLAVGMAKASRVAKRRSIRKTCGTRDKSDCRSRETSLASVGRREILATRKRGYSSTRYTG